MCTLKPSLPSSFVPCQTNIHNNVINPNYETIHFHTHGDGNDDEQQQMAHRWPTPSEAFEEIKAIGKISLPTTLTGLLLYSRSMISMLFLGYLGELELAGGSLAIGFANITGYSIISGLAMGMEPICGQAYGAKHMKLLGLTLQRTILLLLSISIPISFIWLNIKRILSFCGQDQEISTKAQAFVFFSIPDLFFLSVLHPLRIYLRTQGVTMPLTYCSGISVLLHVPLNFLLVKFFDMGISGVALAMVLTNLNLFIMLCSFVYFSGVYKDSWVAPSADCFKGWSKLLALSVPTCISVCLEWWWYEFMIIFCGLLVNPKAAVASMGILIQTTSLVYVFPSSLSLGVSTRVGNELGANRPQRAHISAIISMLCAMLLGLVALFFTTMMRNRWGRFFTNDSEILELTAIALPLAGLCELGNCPQTTGCGVLRGSARPTTGANINLGSFYLVGMPVSVVMGFVFKMGFAGLWIGLLAAQLSCALLMLYVLWTTDWKLQVERAKELTKSSSLLSPSANNDILPLSLSTSSTTFKVSRDRSDHEDEDEYSTKKRGNNKIIITNDDSNNNLEEVLCSNDESVMSISHEEDPLIPTNFGD